MKQIMQYMALVLLTVTLTACVSSGSSEDTPPELFSELDFTSEFYLNKDKLEGSEDYLVWRLVALQALIQEYKFVPANAIIKSLQNDLAKVEEQTPETLQQSESLKLLVADKYHSKKSLKKTKELLSKIDRKQLSELGLTHYLKIYTELQVAYEDHEGAVKSLFVLLPLLKTDKEIQKYNDLLLNQLAMLPAETLQAPQSTPYKAGWYDLAYTYQRYQVRPNKMKTSVEAWRIAYSDHYLLSHMPSQVINLPEFSPYNPEQIAILLPLSGRLQGAGQAVQYGISKAFYQQQKNKKEGEISPKLHFIDTVGSTDKEIASKMKSLNIDFIIGPLMKHEIEGLLPLIESTPTLILNAFPELAENQKEDKDEINIKGDEDGEIVVNKSVHFSFTLSPEDEAAQAATFMQLNGHKNPLILAPNNDYGKRVAAAFNEQWNKSHNGKQNSKYVEVHYFKNKGQFAHFVDKALKTNESKQRINQMIAVTRDKLEYEVRSRRDIDAIYVVSKRNELILLKPFISIAISPFAKEIPLYANSRSHAQDKLHTQDKELVDLHFSDNTFLLNDNLTLTPASKRLLKNKNNSTMRLMGLGYDSYQLIYQVEQMKYIKNYSYKGYLGKLTIDPNNKIQIQLGWATYSKEGKLIEVITPAAGK